MFVNRITGHAAGRALTGDTMPFVLIGAGCVSPAVSAVYRTAYLRAFATVEKRVIRRRRVRAARFVSWN